jgi:2-methylisocitrate lyase-like PEP mutase family enzyme
VQNAPVIADTDPGFGNAVNVAYVTPRHVAAGVKGDGSLGARLSYLNSAACPYSPATVPFPPALPARANR